MAERKINQVGAECRIAVDSSLTANGAFGAIGVDTLISLSREYVQKIDEFSWSFSTILAHTACEIALERLLASAFQSSASSASYKAEYEKHSGKYGYGKPQEDKTQRVFEMLTCKKIKKWDRWNCFDKSIGRRNSIVHAAKPITNRAVAEKSISLCSEFILWAQQCVSESLDKAL